MAGKPRINNDGMERAVLGLVLRDSGLFWRLKDRLVPRLFYTMRHQRIVAIMHKLAEAQRPFEFSAIAGRMAEEQGFDPEAYLFLLNADAGDPTDAFELVSDLEELMSRRQVMDLASELQKAAGADGPMRELLAKALKDVEDVGGGLRTSATPIGEVADRLLMKVCDAFQKERVIGLRAGLKAVDDLAGPFMPGRVYVIAGPPGSGKSALGWALARNFAKSAPGVFFSQEMPGEELAGRDMAATTHIPASRIEAASLNRDEIERLSDAAHDLRDVPIYVDDENGLTHLQIRNRSYRLQRTVGCGWAIVDHLLHCGRTEKRQGMLDAIEQNMKGFKSAAKTLNIPIIVLAQLTKDYGFGDWQKVRTPQVADIYGGAPVEHDSDMILFVHRPVVLLKRKKPADNAKVDEKALWEAEVEKWDGLAQFSLGKRRGGVGDGTSTCYFDGPTMTFSDQRPAIRGGWKPIDEPEIEF